MIVSAIATTALTQMTNSQATIWNRTEMHSGIRGATEPLQQEVGQAGRITLPTTSVAMTTAVNVPAGTFPCTPVFGGGWTGGLTVPVTLASVAGMWAQIDNGIKLA